MVRERRLAWLHSLVGLAVLVGLAACVRGAAGNGDEPGGTSVAQPSTVAIAALSPSGNAAAPPASPGPGVLPWTMPLPSLKPQPSTATVPILYYHRVQRVPKEFATWTPARQRAFLMYDALPAAFSAQLDWLTLHRYTTILPRDLAAYWDLGVPLPPKPVILTFDDGFGSWAGTVLPALQSHGMVAEFYLTLDAIASGGIRWSDVRRLAEAGNGIGGHDVHHVQLAGIPGRRPATPARMWSEIVRIRAEIAAHVGVPPDSMAYVGGGYDATLEALVQKAGYTTARTIQRGIVQTESRRYRMRVVRIGGRDDVVDPTSGLMAYGLPTFSARMLGVSDKPSR